MNEDNLMFGLKDQPIEDKAQEALGLVDYAEVLTEFIKYCDTPMTIALQGDWGSGKTSLMSIIRKELAENSDTVDSFKTVWFNTWQYSQFNMGETLALSMISKITDAIAPGDVGGKMQTLKKGLFQVTKAAVVGGASVLGQGDAAKEGWEEFESKQKETDPSIALEKVKDTLKDIVKEQTQKGISRIVVFIDDLDRLVPVKAVELLEAMKILLDVDNCVYVIACDYSVVVTGLKAKFGMTEGELKGKSFFDKIIQVPFRMPIKRYQVDNYIKQLLEKIRLDFNPEDDIAIYRDLVKYSVGFNPRTMKRLLNTLQLLTVLGEKSDKKMGISDKQIQEKRRHSCRVTFGILCMQESYQSIFDYIVEGASADCFEKIREGIESEKDKEFDNIRKAIGEDRIEDAAEFCKVFVDALQLDEDGDLSEQEISHLNKMLSYSSLVSTGQTAKEIDLKSFDLNLRRRLHQRYYEFEKHKIGREQAYDQFRKGRGVVYFKLPISPWTAFQMYQTGSDFVMSLRSSCPLIAGEITQRLTEKFSWNIADKDESNPDRIDYILIRVPIQSIGDGHKTYMKSVFSNFDDIAKEKDYLYKLCREITERLEQKKELTTNGK
ncbi:MAG: P-loop NTPase fold protein [Bacteroidetes bacterium]|nr:P-loop NTPase fold protein [Bacteroidota bacterium]